MGEPTVGMKYGNYDASMKALASKYRKGENSNIRGIPFVNNAYYDKNNNQVAIYDFTTEYSTTNKYPKGTIRSQMPDAIIKKEVSSSYYIQSPGLWGDNTLRWSGTSKAGEPHNFTRIEGDTTYAQDGAVNPNYKPQAGEKPTSMEDGIVQPWEIFHNK